MKNDLEKLHDHEVEDAEVNSSDDSDSEDNRILNYEDELIAPTKSASPKKIAEKTAEQQALLSERTSSLHLIKDYTDVYKSIKSDRFKTSLVLNRSNVPNTIVQEQPKIVLDQNDHNENTNTATSNTTANDEQQNLKLVRSVNDMASILVKSIIDKAVSEVKSNTYGNCYDLDYINRTYRYNVSAAKNKYPKNSDSILGEFSQNKSNSRLSYYKDFVIDNDVVNDLTVANELADENNNKFLIEFEDEPIELV